MSLEHYDHLEANADEMTRHLGAIGEGIQGALSVLGGSLRSLLIASELNGLSKGLASQGLYEAQKWGLIREAYERGDKPHLIAERFHVPVTAIYERARRWTSLSAPLVDD